MEIRNPDKTHLPSVLGLLERCFPGAWTGTEVQDRIFFDPLYDPNHVWMAREQGRVVGFLACAQDGEAAWLKLLAVDADARRRGLGRDLLSRAEYRLSGEGARVLNVGPRPPREFLPGVEPGSPAGAFFLSQGFASGAGTEARWRASESADDPGPSAPARDLDRPSAAAFAKAHCGPWWPWVEESLACRPARAAFDPGAGLCLAEAGLSLGPLWPAPQAPAAKLEALIRSASAIAASAPAPKQGLWRLWEVEGSAPLPGPTALVKAYNTYTKALL